MRRNEYLFTEEIFSNHEVQYIAACFCDGNFRVFVEWNNGDYYFKVRRVKGKEYGTTKSQLYWAAKNAERQARLNDRNEAIAMRDDIINYYQMTPEKMSDRGLMEWKW